MLRPIMKALGIIGSEPKIDGAGKGAPREELFVTQWKDSAGSWRTEVFEKEPPKNPRSIPWDNGGFLYGPYAGDTEPIAEGYSFTRFGAWINRYTVPIKARRKLARINNRDTTTGIKAFKVKR